MPCYSAALSLVRAQDSRGRRVQLPALSAWRILTVSRVSRLLSHVSLESKVCRSLCSTGRTVVKIFRRSRNRNRTKRRISVCVCVCAFGCLPDAETGIESARLYGDVVTCLERVIPGCSFALTCEAGDGAVPCQGIVPVLLCRLACSMAEGLEQRGLRSRLAPWEHLDPGKAGKTARPREGMLHAAKAHD